MQLICALVSSVQGMHSWSPDVTEEDEAFSFLDGTEEFIAVCEEFTEDMDMGDMDMEEKKMDMEENKIDMEDGPVAVAGPARVQRRSAWRGKGLCDHGRQKSR